MSLFFFVEDDPNKRYGVFCVFDGVLYLNAIA